MSIIFTDYFEKNEKKRERENRHWMVQLSDALTFLYLYLKRSIYQIHQPSTFAGPVIRKFEIQINKNNFKKKDIDDLFLSLNKFIIT